MTASDSAFTDSAPALARPRAVWSTWNSPWALRLPLASVATVSWCMAMVRLHLITLGPDPDGDAYGHHMIARELLKDPLQHGRHWVWLPLFHWLQLPLIAHGGTLDTIRKINVGLWALVPVMLCAYLLQGKARGTTAVDARSRSWGTVLAATTASIVLALTPLGMQMGTTAQPEPLFALLLLAFAWSADARRYGLATGFLTAAVLLRYEAWAVLLFAGLAVAVQLLRRDTATSWSARIGLVLMTLTPGLAILVWALVRMPYDGGKFLWFVRGTHEFAQEALLEKNSFQQGGAVLLHDFLHYIWGVPRRTFGWAVVLAPFGLYTTLRRYPWLVLTGSAVLVFITLGWLQRSTLGLERHFVGVLAWYATLMGFGLVCCMEMLSIPWHRLGRSEERTRTIATLTLAGASAAMIYSVRETAQPWLRDWQFAIEHTFSDQLEVAKFVDALPKSPDIFCDEPTVEGLSHLPYDTVHHGSIDWPPVREQIYAAARADHGTYVISWLGKLLRLPHQGEIVFRPAATRDKALGGFGHPDKTAGLAVMHISAADGLAAGTAPPPATP